MLHPSNFENEKRLWKIRGSSIMPVQRINRCSSPSGIKAEEVACDQVYPKEGPKGRGKELSNQCKGWL